MDAMTASMARVRLWLGGPLRRCLAAGALGIAAHQAASAGDAESALRFAGYNKTIAIRSRSAVAPAEPYSLVLNRTRLKASHVRPGLLELHVENDTELRAGDYFSTAQAGAEAGQPRRGYWDLQSNWTERPNRRFTNDFFRAYARLSAGETDVTGGRQRIPIGTGRLWSTLDMLNPLNPLQLERDEYVGADALLVEHRLASLSKLSLAYAPLPGGGPPRWVGSVRTHWGGSDLSLTLARYWRDDLAGIDLATQVGGMGLRAELTGTRPERGRRYASAMLGLDHAFENTLTLSLETYLSTQRPEDRARQLAAHSLRREIQPPGTRYAGLVASYEFTPLLKLTTLLLANLRDDSRFGAASLAWSVSDNVSLQGGLQRFSGPADSEYGRGQPLAHLQLQWFF